MRPTLVIYLSAYADAPTVARARQTGPAGYLVKPVLDHELRAALARALDGPSPQTQGSHRDDAWVVMRSIAGRDEAWSPRGCPVVRHRDASS